MTDPSVPPLLQTLLAAKASGDFAPLIATIPYLEFIGFAFELSDGEPLGVMHFKDTNVGNYSLPALHGGTIGALLESTAIFTVLWKAETALLPKTITLTISYLRPARPVTTYARAIVTRHGRRVVNVRAEAWQDDPARPVATATALFLIKTDALPAPDGVTA